MATAILADKRGAVLINAETQQAFPPVFADAEAARSFLDFLPADPSELERDTVLVLFVEWQKRIQREAARDAMDQHLAPVSAGPKQRRLARAH